MNIERSSAEDEMLCAFIKYMTPYEVARRRSYTPVTHKVDVSNAC